MQLSARYRLKFVMPHPKVSGRKGCSGHLIYNIREKQKNKTKQTSSACWMICHTCVCKIEPGTYTDKLLLYAIIDAESVHLHAKNPTRNTHMTEGNFNTLSPDTILSLINLIPNNALKIAARLHNHS